MTKTNHPTAPHHLALADIITRILTRKSLIISCPPPFPSTAPCHDKATHAHSDNKATMLLSASTLLSHPHSDYTYILQGGYLSNLPSHLLPFLPFNNFKQGLTLPSDGNPITQNSQHLQLPPSTLLVSSCLVSSSAFDNSPNQPQ